MADFLRRVVAAKRAEIEALRAAAAAAGAVGVPPRAGRAPGRLLDALRAPGLSAIAEIKRKSPSRGALRPGADPAALARAYAGAGAAAISVLTDGPFFGGSLDDLRAVRAAVDLPLLRKDFVLDPLQVREAAAAGADAVLLIARLLDDGALARLAAEAAACGLDVLVEIHDADELARARRVPGAALGINSRDLDDLSVDLDRALRLGAALPADRVRVAESGIGGPADAARVRAAGFHAMLVGTALMRSADPGAALAALLAGARDRAPARAGDGAEAAP